MGIFGNRREEKAFAKEIAILSRKPVSMSIMEQMLDKLNEEHKIEELNNHENKK